MSEVFFIMWYRIQRQFWCVGNSIAVIQLTNKKGESFCILIDEEDLEKVINKPMQITYEGSKRNRLTPYVLITIDGKAIKLHRFLLGNPPFDGRFIDHKSGDTLDDRKSNLRFATPAESAKNIGKPKVKCTSKYKGVRLYKRDMVWTAQISVDNKSVQVGRYQTEKEAAIAYNEAAIKYYGEFARLNDIQ